MEGDRISHRVGSRQRKPKATASDTMSMAAAGATSAATLRLSSAPRSPSASVKPSPLFFPSPATSPRQSRLLRARLPPRHPRLSISAAALMSVRPPGWSSPPSGFLHFVKYHGLGNDFILVRALYSVSVSLSGFSLLVRAKMPECRSLFDCLSDTRWSRLYFSRFL